MTDLSDDEIVELQSVLRALARDQIVPEAPRADRESFMPAKAVAAVHDMGLLSPVGDEHGGQGLPSALVLSIVAEEIALGDPGVAYELMMGAHASTTIGLLGSSAQRERFGRLAAAGPPALGSVQLFEGFGRGPNELCARASPNGTSWRLSGRKIAVVRPGVAEFAVVFANDHYGRMAAFAIDAEHVRCQVVARDDRTVGKLGLRAAHTGVVEFDDLDVGSAAKLDSSPLDIARAVASIRLSAAAIAIAAGTLSVRYAANYATERKAFGKSIAAYQGVAFPLVDRDMDLDAARLALWDLAGKLDLATDVDELADATTLVVAAANAAAYKASVVGINTLGGHGYLEDHPVERWYRAVGTLSCIDTDCLVEQI